MGDPHIQSSHGQGFWVQGWGILGFAFGSPISGIFIITIKIAQNDYMFKTFRHKVNIVYTCRSLGELGFGVEGCAPAS